MSAELGARVAQIEQLRTRMRRLERRTSVVDASGLGMPIATPEVLGDVVQMRVGGTYATESLTLAMMLLAGPSSTGEWTAVVGIEDFGAEAAVELGVDLERTILVPRPKESWLEATAALIDVVTLVLVRPGARVTTSVAEKIGARLRTRDAALVTLGDWPRVDVRLAATTPEWAGVGRGDGHLRSRRLVVEATRGAAPAQRTTLWFPAADGSVRRELAPVADLREREVG